MARERNRSRRSRPEKICPVCMKPFSWRRKWARNWDGVIYCSQKCRRGQAR